MLSNGTCHLCRNHHPGLFCAGGGRVWAADDRYAGAGGFVGYQDGRAADGDDLALVASVGATGVAAGQRVGRDGEADGLDALATVVIGGVFSATVMSLLVLRVLYMVFSGPRTSKTVDCESVNLIPLGEAVGYCLYGLSYA